MNKRRKLRLKRKRIREEEMRRFNNEVYWIIVFSPNNNRISGSEDTNDVLQITNDVPFLNDESLGD
jgi:hypothetical protein